FFFFSSRRRHTRFSRDWSSDVCSSDLTGAGKSIAIDALGLCLGSRAEGDMVRTGASRADLCARFSLKDTPAALRWLEANQLEDGRECLLRRVISSDGRSRGFINGTAVPLSPL